MSLLGVVFLVGTFYVLATGKLPSVGRRDGSDERRATPGLGQGYDGAPHKKVVLHNDDRNNMMSVVLSLRAVPGINLGRAFSVMYEAHTRGSAVVVRCSEESADLHQKNLRDNGLDVTIEPY